MGTRFLQFSWDMQKIDPKSPLYPKAFHTLTDPPQQFFYSGPPSWLEVPMLAIVGARDALPWVQTWLEQELLPVLQKQPVCIVSGGARGIDQWAHILASRAGLPTIAVLPSGIRHLYPKNLNRLSGKIAFLSEYEPEQAMRKFHFYKRNRLIPVMATGLLVVQAQVKSGTMMTAQMAIDQGCPVATLPASPYMENFSGNLKLIMEGAQMVRGQGDLQLWLQQCLNKKG